MIIRLKLTMQNNLTLGEKIRNYRKRAGYSQLQLETEIDAANGSISRIEGGRVNPTKETVLKIGKALGVSTGELNDLLEIRPLFPAEGEIQDAIAEVREYLNREDVIAYLIDEFANYYAVSQGMINLLCVSRDQQRKAYGQNILALISDPQYGVSDKLDSKSLSNTILIETARLIREQGEETIKLIPALANSRALSDFWTESRKISDSELFSPKNKVVRFIIDRRTHELVYTRERLKKSDRFELMEFTKSGSQ